jgi:hypothetical protein
VKPPLKSLSWRWLGIASLLPFVAAAALSGLQTPASKEPLPPDASAAEEDFIVTPAGFSRPGKRAVADGDQIGTVRLSIVDQATGRPTFARINVVGADGNYYEPKDNPLAPWSLGAAYSSETTRILHSGEPAPSYGVGNRPGKGPIRYYGWFFYCSGEAVVRVPAGPVRIEVWKGFEHRPLQVSTHVAAGSMRSITIPLQRTLPMAEQNYYSGDTHIHLSRRDETEEERALDLLAAEDIGIGYLLCWNRSNSYTGAMSRLSAPQERGFGPASVRSRGGYTIASGQEYITGSYGHICLMMHRRLVQEEQTVTPNNWPVFGLLGQETRKLGGYSFHAHGGYGLEIYADFAQRATDGVELLQFADYRGIGLRGWYKMLNIGYRFPAVGACDYPFCRALGDSRTYVQAAARPDPAEWARRAAQGRSFFTTGPMLLLEVDGQPPGNSLYKVGKGPHRIRARVRARCEVTPITHVELIVNGGVVRRLTVPRAAGMGNWLELDESIELSEPSWVAARACSMGPTARADAEAHTNPVYVYVDGKAPYRAEDLDWLVERIQDQINAVNKRRFAEKPRAVAFFEQSRTQLLRIRETKGQRAPEPAQ